MNSLSKTVEKYAAFEGQVSAYATKIYRNHCSECKGACCKPEHCEESLTSPFLNQLRQHYAPDAVYDSGCGWLTPTGCALPVGRPPVCRQYLCDTIRRMRPAPDFRYALTIVSNLVSHVGKKASGRRQMVELQEFSELKRINFTRFEKQLNEADEAFKRVRAFLEGDVAEFDALQILKKICNPPTDYPAR